MSLILNRSFTKQSLADGYFTADVTNAENIAVQLVNNSLTSAGTILVYGNCDNQDSYSQAVFQGSIDPSKIPFPTRWAPLSASATSYTVGNYSTIVQYSLIGFKSLLVYVHQSTVGTYDLLIQGHAAGPGTI